MRQQQHVSIHHPRRARISHSTALGLAVAAALAILPRAQAGETCDTVGQVEDSYGSSASGSGATACGFDNAAAGDSSSAFGYGNTANEGASSAFGFLNTAGGTNSSAIGFDNTASGDASSAFGDGNSASGGASSAFGYHNDAGGAFTSAFGNRNNADGAFSSAFGYENLTSGDFSTAMGSYGQVLSSTGSGSAYSIAIGGGNTATTGARIGTSGGAGSQAAIAIGRSVTIEDNADNSVAIGSGATVRTGVANAVAMGAGAVADRAGTFSVGASGSERQIVNVAAGTADTDAVNLAQLKAMSDAVGGGASYAGGVFGAPSYMIDDTAYSDIGSAFAAVDDRLANLQTEVDTLTSGANGAGHGGAAATVAYDDATHASLTLNGDEGTRIANVATGVEDGDAVNKGQMDAGDAATLLSANDYADAGDARTLSSAKAYADTRIDALAEQWEGFRSDVWDRLEQTDERINRSGAMQTAMAQMTASAAGVRTVNRVAVGVGFQEGEKALSVGYQRAIGQRATVTFGGAFSGDDSTIGAGVGFGW